MYRRNLPHWHPPGRSIFLTWRLAERRSRSLHVPQVATTVCDVILAAEVQRRLCEVYAFVVMPDHVHLLLSPSKPMSQITQWIKGVSGLRANRLLGRTGKSFWQDESFDHWMRSNAEFEKTREYIEANP